MFQIFLPDSHTPSSKLQKLKEQFVSHWEGVVLMMAKQDIAKVAGIVMTMNKVIFKMTFKKIRTIQEKKYRFFLCLSNFRDTLYSGSLQLHDLSNCPFSSLFKFSCRPQPQKQQAQGCLGYTVWRLTLKIITFLNIIYAQCFKCFIKVIQ